MRQLVYALRFTGRASPASPDASVLMVMATATDHMLTLIGPDKDVGALAAIPAGETAFTSEVTLTGATSFQDAGTITFGESDRLRFSTVGSGYLDPSPDLSFRHGAVVWRVDAGEGQFAGAGGLITSNFIISSNGDVTDHHFGVIFLR